MSLSRLTTRASLLLVASLLACTFNASGIDSEGPPTSGGTVTGSSTGEGTTTTTTSATTTEGTTTTTTTTDATTVSSTSGPGMCQDGVLDPGEECDLADNGAGGTCTPECKFNVCGDAFKGLGEGCDDGNQDDTDGCKSDCTLLTCGNDVLDDGEECDDGNMINDDACTNACTTAKCGDGIFQMGLEKECDEGGATANCDADCSFPECGDGELNMAAGEACDDSNMDDTDDCAACQVAVCGDGFVRAGMEACDDGNQTSGDGCDDMCQWESLRVFVTSMTFKGNLGGLAGADAKCQDAANAAMAGGTWMAWLSDGMKGPATRFTTKDHPRPYVLTDGKAVASNWADLLSPPLVNNINKTEDGSMVGSPNDVWTNTNPDGTPTGSDKLCSGWSSAMMMDKGNHGDRNQKDATWTAKGNVGCDTSLHLYCFEQ